ncbi:hypothetical protein PVT01_080006000 [Plasmodium vivax]|uniref:Uncharacterized protein n=1 Tax=Plasmodium vivax TaxID=5855 RepID=A0A1G4GVW4_PLAVI|nr:hypothetical protein PVT01_080006000 [Plasmodium vivax]
MHNARNRCIKEKNMPLYIMKVFTVALFIWMCHYSDDSTCGKSLNKKKSLGNPSELRNSRIIAAVDYDSEQRAAGPSHRASDNEKSSMCETTETELAEKKRKKALKKKLKKKKLKRPRGKKTVFVENDFVPGGVRSEYLEKENLTTQEKDNEDSDVESAKQENGEMWYVEDESGDWELAGTENTEQQKGECSYVNNENKEWADSDTEGVENEYIKLLNGEVSYLEDVFPDEEENGKKRRKRSKKKSKKKPRKKKTLYVEGNSELKNVLDLPKSLL